MHLINDIMTRRIAFLELHGHLPQIIYLGERECQQLCTTFGDLPSRLTGSLPDCNIAGMKIIQVQLPSYFEFGS
ncbi:hypothetical protein [Chitinilyticum aquatile]|uniref:hypothetical protein n=1 Tax=Chitinilyticum aquatile TaxID=362520 RepID=UPI0004047951|nr:hypothetical protein [Chitinilyticum aquatile]